MGVSCVTWSRAALVAAVALFGLVGRADAHHSFAMFDTVNRATISGTVTSFEWTNPHVFIEIDVPDEKGGMKHWSVELGSTSILMRGGWKFNDIKAGDKVTALINPLRNGQPGGMLVRITLADGRVMGNGGPPPADAPPPR